MRLFSLANTLYGYVVRMPVGFLKSNVDEINLMIYCFTSTDCRELAAEIAFFTNIDFRSNSSPF